MPSTENGMDFDCVLDIVAYSVYTGIDKYYVIGPYNVLLSDENMIV